MLKYITIGAVLSAALLWSYASDDRTISFIEKDLTTQLNSVASKTPNDLFDYIVAGRDVIIQIREFGREDEIDTLQQQIASVAGVDNIFLVGSVANPATAPAIAALSGSGSNKLFVEIQIDNNVLTVTGNASDPKATEIVLQNLIDSKGTEVINYLDFYPGIPSLQWLEHLEILTNRLPTDGSLLITESGVSRYGGIFEKAKTQDSSKPPLQAENTRLTDSDQPVTLPSDPAIPIVVADDNTNPNLLAIVNDNAASVEEVVENTDVNQTNSKFVGEEWIAQLDGASFIIQFGTTLDLERVDDFIPVISRGEPIAVYAYKTTPSGRPIYGIATGVYATLRDARDRVTSLPSKARAYNPWIRSIAEIQLQISETQL